MSKDLRGSPKIFAGDLRESIVVAASCCFVESMTLLSVESERE